MMRFNHGFVKYTLPKHMGRKSALTPEQWVEVERRHLIGGESVNSLAKEFGVNEGTIRKKINPNSSEREKVGKPLRELAQEKVVAERSLKNISDTVSKMPMARQKTFNDLFVSLLEISSHAAAAGAYGMATAHRLSALAHSEVQKIDDANPLASVEQLRGIAALTTLANESSKIGMNLLAANKELFKPSEDETPNLVDPDPDV